jgi:CBS domain-containing protein
MKATSKSHELPIHRRQTIGAGGAVVEAMTVACPRQANSIPLDECLFCEFCGGVDPALAGREPTLECGYRSSRRLPRKTHLISAEDTQVSAVMTATVACVRPELDLDSAARLLLEMGIGGLPVVDGEGRPIGVLSKTDLVRHRYEDCDVSVMNPGEASKLGPGFHTEAVPLSVEDVMTPVAFDVLESTSIADASALMAYESVHRVPVVNEEGAVVGIVTALDLVRWLAEVGGHRVPARRSRRFG